MPQERIEFGSIKSLGAIKNSFKNVLEAIGVEIKSVSSTRIKAEEDTLIKVKRVDGRWVAEINSESEGVVNQLVESITIDDNEARLGDRAKGGPGENTEESNNNTELAKGDRGNGEEVVEIEIHRDGRTVVDYDGDEVELDLDILILSSSSDLDTSTSALITGDDTIWTEEEAEEFIEDVADRIRREIM